MKWRVTLVSLTTTFDDLLEAATCWSQTINFVGGSEGYGSLVKVEQYIGEGEWEPFDMPAFLEKMKRLLAPASEV